MNAMLDVLCDSKSSSNEKAVITACSILMFALCNRVQAAKLYLQTQHGIGGKGVTNESSDEDTTTDDDLTVKPAVKKR
jgi:hypothetical protein